MKKINKIIIAILITVLFTIAPEVKAAGKTLEIPIPSNKITVTEMYLDALTTRQFETLFHYIGKNNENEAYAYSDLNHQHPIIS